MCDEMSSLRATMAIVDADKSGGGGVGEKRGSFDLTDILEKVVCLHEGHGEVPASMPPGVLVPEQSIPGAAAADGELVVGLEAGAHNPHDHLPNHVALAPGNLGSKKDPKRRGLKMEEAILYSYLSRLQEAGAWWSRKVTGLGLVSGPKKEKKEEEIKRRCMRRKRILRREIGVDCFGFGPK